MIRAAAIVGSSLYVLSLSFSAHAQGHSPQEALARMTVPPGFRVRLFANEPDVRQPVAIEFDDRGRLWVIQYLQYPNPAGLKRVAWDRYSRTTYDRVPEPPPRGPRGADRVTICEDTDGDGRADRFHDFIDGLNLATGLAFGDGGVYVLQVPYLLFYPDRDRDDVPDGDPQVLLTGFGMEDAHSVANSLVWGPDGWLYGAQGSTVTAHIRGIEFQQGVWRYHPPTDRFELFYEGGGNTWGVDFDARGNLFACTNVGGYALLHGVQGGYYWKSFGKHGELHNPHAYGYFEHIAHQGLTGAHVTCGGVVYQGAAFPPEFRGTVIAANLLSHRVDWHRLTPAGSTFTARQEGTLLDANDPWFAPCDVTIGPDGAVYVADWHDERTAHPDPDAEWDRTNGRIYVVEPVDVERQKSIDLAGLSPAELASMLHQPNDWYRRRARRLLAERKEFAAVEPLAARAEQETKLQALWTRIAAGDVAPEAAVQLLDGDADTRRWAVRTIGDAPDVAPGAIRALIELAARETDPGVRSQLAATARRVPAEQAIALVAALLQRDDAGDAHIPLLMWWAIEPAAVAHSEQIVAQLITADNFERAAFRDELAPRLARRFAADGSASSFEALAQLLAACSAASLDRLVEAAAAGLSGAWETVPAPIEPWIVAHWTPTTVDAPLITLATLLGNGAAQDRAREIAYDAKAAEPLRLTMIELVGRLHSPADIDPLLALVAPSEIATIQAASLHALAAFDDPRIPSALLARWSSLAPPIRAAAVDLLLARPASARLLLEAVDSRAVPPPDVPVASLQPLAASGDARIEELIRKHWGQLGAVTPGEVLAEVRRLNNDLRAASGDAEQGRLLFREHCGKCHKLFGEGQAVGPDLTTANRQDRDYLLTSIVDPSSVVRKEYLSYLVATKDGRSLTGLIVDESPQRMVLVDAQGNRATVETAAIDALEPAPQSLMPQRLLEKLAPQQLRDLFAFLQQPAPRPE